MRLAAAAAAAMSGNPFGLSELSHYGSMQRVGGKAAGFINKKFFHPSSLRNQEKLWKAQTENAREERKQAQMEKQREEERQVEALKKQMYLRGQSSGDFSGAAGLSRSAMEETLTGGQKKEQRDAHDEFKKRKALLRGQRASEEAKERGGEPLEEEAAAGAEADAEGGGVAGAGVAGAGDAPILAKSSLHQEDVHPNGHESVWGSWFSTEDKRWGFECCKSLERKKRCPLAPEEEEPSSLLPKQTRTRTEHEGKRRRRGGAKDKNGGADAGASETARGAGTDAGAEAG